MDRENHADGQVPVTRSRRALRRPPPWFILIPGAVGLLLFAVPVIGLVIRTPWGGLSGLLSTGMVKEALWLSLLSSVAAAAISLLLGVPLAWILARCEFPGRSVVRGVALLPLVLPPVVGGAALLFALGRRGMVGAPLHRLTGLVLPFSMAGVIVAAAFVAMPLMVVTVEGALRSLDPRYERAAETLGAGRWTVLRRVTLPMIAPSLVAGTTLTWARALGEFGATLTFAGSVQGRTQTLPLAVFVALESDRDTAIAISMVMVAVSLAVLISLRDHWWRRR